MHHKFPSITVTLCITSSCFANDIITDKHIFHELFACYSYKSEEKSKMSDDEFCDPDAAHVHWQKSANATAGVARWKRQNPAQNTPIQKYEKRQRVDDENTENQAKETIDLTLDDAGAEESPAKRQSMGNISLVNPTKVVIAKTPLRSVSNLF